MSTKENPKKAEPKFKINLTDHNIDELKAKHKKVKLIAVHTRDGQRHEFLIVRPNQSITDALTKNVMSEKPHKNREIFRNSCIIDGDKDVFDTDMDVQNKVIEKIMDLFDSNLEVDEKEL